MDELKDRRSPRHAVTMHAVCRTETGDHGNVSIVDLTREGCCIFTKGLPLREGQNVRIRPDNFQPLPGVVRWVLHDYAGIEFDAALYEAVAEHLQKAFSALGSQ